MLPFGRSSARVTFTSRMGASRLPIVRRPKRVYGTHPDLPDHRNLHHEAPPHLCRRLPARVDLRPGPPIYTQGSLNSCSTNALAAAMWFDELKEGLRGASSPSRLFIYYNERARTGRIGANIPVSLRDGYKAVAGLGACPEPMWPYRVSAFARRPGAACYRAGRVRRVTSYHRIRRELGPLRACLAEGYPFTLAITVYKSFESAAVARTGRVPLPKRGERVLGGHAMLAMGYDDAAAAFIVRNSFGAGWGDAGHCLLPYDYVMRTDLAWDFWTARRVMPGRRRRSGTAAR